jgi:hypothetical protein
MQPNSRDDETFSIILHMLWECRNVFIDLNEFKKSAYVEKCINDIVCSNSAYNYKDLAAASSKCY